MKKVLLAAVISAFASLFYGCAPTVVVDGVRYTALTERQRAQMVAFCRRSIKLNAQGKLTRQEVAFIQRNEPEIKIQYTGDCYGYATVAWYLPTRTIDMKFAGDLLSERPHVMLGISDPEAQRQGVLPDKSTH